ncbi:conjugative transfer ATPase [Vibrio europaeus]|uniref:conjugative transfer ATPase n=1 Tax=Vibrio europaeus TaxID=300876 RepID=UPI00233E5CD6|nr:conjugative transfer ATPase [Vibrio europaeus]MDC5870278.1 conjugative transfer ATPase [Vibrio europaeus]
MGANNLKQLAKAWLDAFKLYDRESYEIATNADMDALYRKKISFTNKLPYAEYLSDEECFLLDDEKSVAAVCDIFPANAEGVTLQQMANIRDNVQSFLKETYPQEDKDPWVVEFFQSDILSLNYFAKVVQDYVNGEGAHNPMTDAYLPIMEQHLKDVCKEGGLFLDDTVTGQPWRGSLRVYRMIYYRKYSKKNKPSRNKTPIQELQDLRLKVESQLGQYGIKTHRVGGKDFFEWMVRWFNPRPKSTGGDVDKLIENFGYDDKNLPYGHDLAENMFCTPPESNVETGSWYFDGLPHKIVPVLNLRKAPTIGCLSAPKEIGSNIASVFDRMPEGTVMSMKVVIKPVDKTDRELSKVEKDSKGQDGRQQKAQEEAQIAKRKMAYGDPMFPCEIAFFVRGENDRDLEAKTNQVVSTLQTQGLNAIDEEKDLIILDSYIKNLPMNYEYARDKERRRSRLIFSQQIANMVPIFGRGKGTGHPGLLFWTRGGEPMCFDPLNPDDRAKNAHLLIFGPTGSGKSAQLVGILLFIMAVYNARIFLVEAGNSFELLRMFVDESGASTQYVRMVQDDPTTLSPFSNAIKALELEEEGTRERDPNVDVVQEVHDAFSDGSLYASGDDDDDDDDEIEQKDYLGEMEITARIMVSGGKKDNADKITLGDQQMLRQCILNAAKKVKDEGRDQVIVSDVVAQVELVSKDKEIPTSVSERFYEYGQAMRKFTQGLAGKKFNQPGSHWQDVDFTHIDLASFVRDGYEAELAVSYMSILNYVNDIAERDQHLNRPIIFLTDESHVITKNALLAPGVVKVSKMWRKLGAWLWMATQNMKDFPDEAEVMLGLFEWWLCLNLEKDEVKEVTRFKDLTDEQKYLLGSARKQNAAYTEGVVFSSKLEELFRAVPPSLTLVLAWSEKHEKAKLRKAMEQHKVNRLEAARICAAKIDDDRGIVRKAA